MSIRISVSTDDLPQVLRMIKEAGEDLDVAVTVTGPQDGGVDVSAAPAAAGRPAGVSASQLPGEAMPVMREAMDKLTRMASRPDRERLVSFIEQQIREHGAVIDPGPKLLKYVRLHLPSHRGAYCYPTTRGFVDFRLEPEDQEGCTYAFVRGGDNHGAPYCVRLRLDSDAAMDEALALARTAVRKLRGAR